VSDTDASRTKSTCEPSDEVLHLTDGSAWGDALRIGALHGRRAAENLGASVRGLSRAVGSSASRVGDLRQIRDAVTDSDVLLIGLADEPSAEAIQDFELRGHALLARLSFRALREVARLPRFTRVAEVRRRAAAAVIGTTGAERETHHAATLSSLQNNDRLTR
jgi:hypothetical protein